MRKLIFTLCCLLGAMASTTRATQESNTTFVESASHDVFEGVFKSVWARLRSMSPSQRETANAEQQYTAGLRGAESVDTLLKPYWKNDLTDNPEFQAELQQFSLAQTLMDRGELDTAVESFDRFLAAHGESSLRPNALFGKSLSQAGRGETVAARATMQQFLDENPNHPLARDARRVLEVLE